MEYEDLKLIVGRTGRIIITSDDYRYSELYDLVERVGLFQMGILTIVVKTGTLNDSEIKRLAKLGGQFVQFDFSQP